MNRNVIHTLCLVALFLFICCMLRCATSYTESRFYSGPPLPNNETVLVYAVSGCQMSDIRDEKEKEEKLLGPAYLLEKPKDEGVEDERRIYNGYWH